MGHRERERGLCPSDLTQPLLLLFRQRMGVCCRSIKSIPTAKLCCFSHTLKNQHRAHTRVSLLLKCTTQPSFSAVLDLRVVCRTDCTTLISGM